MKDKVVLITGGTQGIGLATALQFAQAGARLYLTYKWGSADMDQLNARFTALSAEKPVLLEADVSQAEDTDQLLAAIAKQEKKVDVFISNVGFAQRTMTLDEYKKKSLFKTLEYSTWPMIEYTRKIKALFGSYPGYVIGISSDGPDHFYPGYDFVAASKALLEFFSKYLSVHLFAEGSRVNVIRFGTVKTDSFAKIFGEEFFTFIKEQGIPEEMVLTPTECGKAVLALCSGLLDAMNGQIITVDKGMPFRDNLMMRYFSKQKS
ncbi:SDR family oxidoreductase [bacterium]|nr:SDR family oxidoreductase [bacterium]